MARIDYNTLSVEYPDAGVNSPNIQLGVTHFLNSLQTEMTSQPMTSIMNMFPVITQAGHNVSPWFDNGHNSPNEYTDPNATGSDIRQVDRSFKADATEGLRQTGHYRIFDIGFQVADDEMNQSQFDLSRSIARRIMQLKSRLEVQVVLDTLGGVPLPSVTTVKKSQRLNSIVPANLSWNPTTKQRVETGASGTQWNLQKVLRAKRNLKQVGQFSRGAVVLASNITMDGFNTDEQVTNGDYAVWAGGFQGNDVFEMTESMRWGMEWISLSEFPNQKNGQPGGIATKTSGTNGVTGDVTQEYIVGRDSVRFIQSAEQPMFRTRVFYDEREAATLYRFTAYIGAMVIRPNGIVLVENDATGYES